MMESRQLSRLFMSFCSLFVLLTTVVSFAEIITTPAFNEAARQNGVAGDWRVPEGAAHYYDSQYLFQLGYGILNPETARSAFEGSGIIAGTFGMPIQGPQEAVELLSESLALSPGNTHAWASLAWAHALNGEIEQAREVMAVSWDLAPYDLKLASSRLAFVEYIAVTGTPSQEFELQAFEYRGAANDYQTLALHNPDAAEIALSSSDSLRLIIQNES